MYLALSSEWVLKNEHERRELELRLGRKLKLSEAFDSRIDVHTTLRLRQDAAVVQELHDAQRKYKDDEAAEEKAKRTGVIPELHARVPNWRTSFSKEASEAWTKIIRHYAKTEMRKAAKRLGMRIAPGSWPRPDNLPTFWYGESFYIAKSLFVFVDTEKELTSKKSLKSMPDMMDATHFRDAAYADVLVTQDENFRTVAVRANTGLKVMTFDDFARLVLASASSLGTRA